MKKIAILRKQKNLSQEDLAKILNIGQSTLSGYETGCYEPDINTLIKIANYFNVSIDYLLDYNAKDYILITKKEYENLLKIKEPYETIMKIKQRNENNTTINDNHGIINIKNGDN